eukprot:gene15592-18524_t
MDANILQAIKYGHTQILLSTPIGGLNDQVEGGHGQGYLHLASEAGHENVVRHLVIKCKMNVNRRDNDGLMPLHWACIEGKHLAANLLLANGALVNAPDNEELQKDLEQLDLLSTKLRKKASAYLLEQE